MTAESKKEVAVVIKFLQGSFQTGFDVSLEILNAGVCVHQADIPNLPPAPELPALYQTWRSRYIAIGSRAIKPVANQPTHSRSAVQDCRTAAKALEQAMTEWFQDNSFKFLCNEIRAQRIIHEDDSVPVIFSFRVAETDQLRRLPWHIWDLFRTDFLNAEVVLQARVSPSRVTAEGPLKVLAIYGSETGGISTQDDRTAWEALQARPDVSITSLEQPKKSELRQILTQQRWDILFFAGHSSSADSQYGTLQIGQQPDGSPRLIAIAQLKEDLRRAVRNGLKLAIFNSCDGLGIADLLTELGVPFSIVMREPVADLVARRFIQFFLQRFAKDKQFYTAVRAARRELDWLENDFYNPLPSATWLPIVLQDPSQPEFKWPSPPKTKSPKIPVRLLAGILSGIALLGVGISQLKGSNTPPADTPTAIPYSSVSADFASLGEDALTPKPAIRNCDTDLKNKAVRAMADGQYTMAKDTFNTFLNTCSEDAEAQIYRNNAIVLQNILGDGADYEMLSDSELSALNTGSVMLSLALPLQGDEPDVAQEIMRGAVAAQARFNMQDSSRKMLLQVVNDDYKKSADLSDSAVEVAKLLSADPAVFAVVGHYSSGATEEAGLIYGEAGLVAVSPTSTAIRKRSVESNQLKSQAVEMNDYIFRTSPSDRSNAEALVQDMKSKGIASVLMAYDKEDPYTVSLQAVTEVALQQQGMTVEGICNFSEEGRFNAEACLEKGPAAEALAFFPSSEVKSAAGELLAAADSSLPIWGGDAVYSNDNFLSWGETFNGARVIVPWHQQSNYNDGGVFGKGEGKNWRSAMAYDATMTIAAGLQQQAVKPSGVLDRKGLRTILADRNFVADGVLGEQSVRFNRWGDRTPAPNLTILVEVTAGTEGYTVQPINARP